MGGAPDPLRIAGISNIEDYSLTQMTVEPCADINAMLHKYWGTKRLFDA